MTLEDFQAEQSQAAAELADLTPRQREVLILAAKGLQNKQIADSLGLSIKSIENHRWRCQERLDMSFVEAVVLAVKARWV